VLAGTGGQLGEPHIPPTYDFSSMCNSWNLIVSALSHYVSIARWVVQASICLFKIAWNFKGWELEVDCEDPMVDTLWSVRKSSIVVFEYRKNLGTLLNLFVGLLHVFLWLYLVMGCRLILWNVKCESSM